MRFFIIIIPKNIRSIVYWFKSPYRSGIALKIIVFYLELLNTLLETWDQEMRTLLQYGWPKMIAAHQTLSSYVSSVRCVTETESGIPLSVLLGYVKPCSNIFRTPGASIINTLYYPYKLLDMSLFTWLIQTICGERGISIIHPFNHKGAMIILFYRISCN